MKAWPLLTVAALILCGCGSAASAAAALFGYIPPAPTTVTYCRDGGTPETLDMYEPRGQAGPHPLLMVVHGGSWATGSSALDQQSQLTQTVVSGAIAEGFAVASINYRLAPAHRWPAQIVDVRCAVRFLRATASRWDINAHHVVALGDSAGAQLVSLDALSAQLQPQWDSRQWAGQSSALEAVVDCWGPADLVASGWSRLAKGIGRNVFGVAFGAPADVLRTASPVTYVTPGAPPFLVIQGLSDILVPPAQSAELHSRLVAAGDRATLIDVAGAGHGLGPPGAPMVPTLDAVAEQTVSWLASVSR
jgi:acetyl esterase/lipase